jgi:(E)-4-hydroxy-3-methylbut-2-enyl-diphosphate synthase
MDKFCDSLTTYTRRNSREVRIGNLLLGGENPIRLQSMTTTDTMDTKGSVEQSIRMIEAGCELVRITAPSKKEAENLQTIKDQLKALGYDTPLVADIHFTPNAAEIAARIVEKVRVNPGNYADKKKFENIEYTDDSYQAELARIEKKFTPLVRICKEEGVAMRIGTNHGSLSDRIMSRYGDTPTGMVESAMEFLRICRKHDYHDIVLSMKASNTLVMVQAYRLLVSEMNKEGMDYPLHLGVTEAGDGEDGRIKSAVGIGTLLEDGLGDTVRVSLTEDPEVEIPVAKKLVDRYLGRENHQAIPEIKKQTIDFFNFQRRNSQEVLNIGSSHVPVVFGDLSKAEKISQASFFAWGYNYSVPLDKWNIMDQAADYVFIGKHQIDFEIPGTLSIIQDYEVWSENMMKERHYALVKADSFLEKVMPTECPFFVQLSLNDLLKESIIQKLEDYPNAVLVLETQNLHGMAEQRRAIIELMSNELRTPVIAKRSYRDLEVEDFQLASATDLGALLVDGLLDGIWPETTNCGGAKVTLNTAFGILQASRSRISKTEYISCPSCGRTLFDLQETTAKIRAVTSHLKGVKIGIMGCIVNGPGEMADAA